MFVLFLILLGLLISPRRPLEALIRQRQPPTEFQPRHQANRLFWRLQASTEYAALRAHVSQLWPHLPSSCSVWTVQWTCTKHVKQLQLQLLRWAPRLQVHQTCSNAGEIIVCFAIMCVWIVFRAGSIQNTFQDEDAARQQRPCALHFLSIPLRTIHPLCTLLAPPSDM